MHAQLVVQGRSSTLSTADMLLLVPAPSSSHIHSPPRDLDLRGKVAVVTGETTMHSSAWTQSRAAVWSYT